MKHMYNCKNCVNRVVISDNMGFMHEFCRVIYSDRQRPIHHNKLTQEISCDAFEEEEDG